MEFFPAPLERLVEQFACPASAASRHSASPSMC